MSRGVPTRLVRDGAVASNDPVDDEPFKVTPTRIESPPASGGHGIVRADDAQRADPYDSKGAVRAAFDVYDQSGPVTPPLLFAYPPSRWFRSLKCRSRNQER
jgi:hypothetical protein